MKLLLTTIAAVLVVGCATTQSPEPPTGKAPDISIVDAAKEGNIKTIKQEFLNDLIKMGFYKFQSEKTSDRKNIIMKKITEI